MMKYLPLDALMDMSSEDVDAMYKAHNATPELLPAADCPSTIPSSREPTAIAPATVDHRERITTQRLCYITLGVAFGDVLVHFLVWVLS
jgi:hypothetical protein